MATHRKSIMQNLQFDSSGNGYFAPYADLATNDQWNPQVAVFKDTSTRIVLYGTSSIPKNYVGTASVIIVWTSTATSGNVVWDFDYRAVGGNDSESLDQTGTQEAVTVTDAAPGAAHRRLEVSISLTSSNLAADDTIEFLIARDGADGSDTMAASAILAGVFLEYSDA